MSFVAVGSAKGEKMTVLELISSWTEEERRHHAALITECLQRELFLNDLRGRMSCAEKELAESLRSFSEGLDRLARSVDQHAHQMEDLYLRLVKPKAIA